MFAPANLAPFNPQLFGNIKTGCLTGILIVAYYNPHITGRYNPLYTLNNHVPGCWPRALCIRVVGVIPTPPHPNPPHSCVASTMCAMIRQAQLRSIHHVFKFKECHHPHPTPPHPTAQLRSIHHVCNDKTSTVA